MSIADLRLDGHAAGESFRRHAAAATAGPGVLPRDTEPGRKR